MENTSIKTVVELPTIDESQYLIVMHNDDITTFDFVIKVLNEVFDYNVREAALMAMYIDEHGQSVITMLPKEEAVEKLNVVENYNIRYDEMLSCTIEKA